MSQVVVNAASSVVQGVAGGLIVYFLYGFLYVQLGATSLGAWAVVMAIAGLPSIANFGISASVVKFVAQRLARGEPEAACVVVQTSALALAGLYGAAAVIAYPLTLWYVASAVPAEHLAKVQGIVPICILSMWVSAIAAVFLSGIEGNQRSDLRSLVALGGSATNLVLCLWWVPGLGLKGLALAQAAHTLVLLALSWVTLRRLMPRMPLGPYRWSRAVFREMLGYGLSFQVINLSWLLFDPLTKMLLARLGGLGLTGHYEMASKLVLQIRSLIVGANQVLVPTIADAHERDRQAPSRLYETSYRLMLFAAFPVFGGLVALAPAASLIWLRRYEPDFVFCVVVLAAGWMVNALAAPAFFVFSGVGYLRWNMVSNILVGVLNALLGFSLGSVFGGRGVIIGWACALAAGSLVLPLAYLGREGLSRRSLLPGPFAVYAAVCCFCAAGGLLGSIQARDRMSGLAMASVVGSALFCIQGAAAWASPLRSTLTGWFGRRAPVPSEDGW